MTENTPAEDVAPGREGRDEAADWLDATRRWADGQIGAFLDHTQLGPPELEAAIRYALMGGGKRIRPALVRLVGEALEPRATPDAIARCAVAVECLHTYSLVHDDLPCMDDDDLRRGRPTVHVAFDEATAVLVGDALQTLAFECLAAGPESVRTVGVLARAAGPAGMVGGQVLDLASGGRDPEPDRVEAIHRAKTAALLGAAAELGACAAGAPGADLAGARRFGEALGLCFQAMDDVLDVTGSAEALGKTPGKDASVEKGTLVAALGLDGAREAARRHAADACDAAASLGLGAMGAGLVRLLLDRSS